MGYTVGLYVPRLAVVSWNPLALVGRTWQFCGKPPRNQASTVWLRQLSRSIFQDQCIERFIGVWPSYENEQLTPAYGLLFGASAGVSCAYRKLFARN